MDHDSEKEHKKQTGAIFIEYPFKKVGIFQPEGIFFS